MLAQTTQDKPPSALIQVPVFQSPPRTELRWRLLPIAYLDNFECITSQFASFGLKFEDTIALRPSNPRFLNKVGPRVLMPVGQQRSFKVKLEKATTHVHLWLMGSREITVSTLNAQGHCIAVAETSKVSGTNAHEPYQEQSLTLETRMAKVIHIDSKAPFVATRFAVKQ